MKWQRCSPIVPIVKRLGYHSYYISFKWTGLFVFILWSVGGGGWFKQPHQDRQSVKWVHSFQSFLWFKCPVQKHTHTKGPQRGSVYLKLIVYWHFLELHYRFQIYLDLWIIIANEAMLPQTKYHCGLRSAAVWRWHQPLPQLGRHGNWTSCWLSQTGLRKVWLVTAHNLPDTWPFFFKEKSHENTLLGEALV